MNKIIAFTLALFALCGCQESLEDKCAREAREYTEKNCPAKLGDNIIIDSMTFDKESRTLHYFYTLTGNADNRVFVAKMFEGKCEFTFRKDPPKDMAEMVKKLGKYGVKDDIIETDTAFTILGDAKHAEEIQKYLVAQAFPLIHGSKSTIDGREMLLNSVRNATNMRAFMEAKYNFAYHYYSMRAKQQLLYETTITAKEYQKYK